MCSLPFGILEHLGDRKKGLSHVSMRSHNYYFTVGPRTYSVHVYYQFLYANVRDWRSVRYLTHGIRTNVR